MSDLIIKAASIFIAVFAAVAYIVMAWPFFLAVVAVWMVWKASKYGRKLWKGYIEKLMQIPNYL
ncbi:MAG: hypothetical protein M0R70_09300 [Nitrospirae bacterium]|nr:hypothetical protein [Nitrospirota bacterium]